MSLFIIAVVIVPLLLNCSFDASALLSYYGSLIASIIAICGVVLTIQYSQKNYREDVRYRALPYISICQLRSDVNYTIQLFPQVTDTTCDSELKKQDSHIEYKLQNYYCIIDKGNIRYMTQLSNEQQELINNCGVKTVSNSNGMSTNMVDYIYIPLEIENIGNGAAAKFSFGINKESDKESTWKFVPAISLKTATPFMLHIFSEDCSEQSDIFGNYVLSFHYDDIYHNRYRQDFIISIAYDEKNKFVNISTNIDVDQKFLEVM